MGSVCTHMSTPEHGALLKTQAVLCSGPCLGGFSTSLFSIDPSEKKISLSKFYVPHKFNHGVPSGRFLHGVKPP